jgi:hypothetical protein
VREQVLDKLDELAAQGWSGWFVIFVRSSHPVASCHVPLTSFAFCSELTPTLGFGLAPGA